MQTRLFIDNRWIDGSQHHAVVSPASGTLIEHVHLASPRQLEEAVHGAQHAFESRPRPHQRRDWLHAIAHAIESRSDAFAQTICLEAGKPISLARLEVTRALTTFRTAAEEAVRMQGEVLNLDFDQPSAGRMGLVKRFPLGVVLGISPFNFPLGLVGHKVAPALAVGCPTVLRPSRATPLTALLLAEACLTAELPPGWLQVVPCDSRDASVLVRHPLVRKLTFTGSADIGWKLREQAFDKHVTLELGGNAAVIVDESADLDLAAKRCALGAFLYAGQVCISVQRVLCHARVYDAFRERLVRETLTLGVGDPANPDVVVGPMITPAEADRVWQWVAEAKAAGARVMTPLERSGSVVRPVLLEGAGPDLKVNREEVFGPVCTLAPFDDFAQGVAMANDSSYGLQAGVFTRDLDHAMYAFEHLEVGGVIHNDYSTFRTDPMPYGGVKRSGYGREGVRYAMDAMTEPRLLVLRQPVGV